MRKLERIAQAVVDEWEKWREREPSTWVPKSLADAMAALAEEVE